MLAPPHSLQSLLVRWCVQMLVPPHSDARAPALLALAPDELVLADARAPALLTSAPPAPVLADARAPALLARAPSALVKADAALSCRTFCCRPRCCPGPAAADAFGRIAPRECVARRSLCPGFGALWRARFHVRLLHNCRKGPLLILCLHHQPRFWSFRPFGASIPCTQLTDPPI